MNQHKTGLTLGAFAALVHILWAILVAMNLGQMWMDFVLGLHFLNNPFQVMPFASTNAVMLIVLVAVIGYIVGFVFATVWNKVKQ
jgi:hypothetical protein